MILVGWGFSRNGGVQEVSRQVADTLRHNPSIDLKTLFLPHSKILARCVRAFAKSMIAHDTVFFFMHPQIFTFFTEHWPLSKWPKTIVWAHGIDVWGNFGKQIAPHLDRANKILSSSHYTEARIHENFPNADVSVVPLAPFWEPTFHYRPSSAPFEILTLARLAGSERYKGHDLVLKALSILKARGIVINYHIVGRGPDEARLKSLASDFCISSQVFFHGFLQDEKVCEVFARSSVHVMPSFVVKSDHKIWSGEGLGLAYLEAACHGLPSIASDEGGQQDCILHGETGYLIPPDPHIIAARLEYLFKNREKCRQMGERARRFVAENFTHSIFSNTILRALQAVFGETVSPTIHPPFVRLNSS